MMAKKRAKKAKPAKRATAKRAKKVKVKPAKKAKVKSAKKTFAKPAKRKKASVARRARPKTQVAPATNVPSPMDRFPSWGPGGGHGRVDVVRPVPEGVRVDPDITEGHPGYEDSDSSEISPAQRLPKSEPAW